MFFYYFWISFGASFYWLTHIPSQMSRQSNIISSALLSLSGFVLWPLWLWAFWKSKS